MRQNKHYCWERDWSSHTVSTKIRKPRGQLERVLQSKWVPETLWKLKINTWNILKEKRLGHQEAVPWNNYQCPVLRNQLDFPGGTVAKNPPANAGDTSSSPGPGRSHMPRSNWAHAPQLLSLRSRARKPQLQVVSHWIYLNIEEEIRESENPACLKSWGLHELSSLPALYKGERIQFFWHTGRCSPAEEGN